MSEGNVYLCEWKKAGRKLTLSLKNDPDVKVTASDLDAAEEQMWELLCEKFGDGEAVLEYVTPPPRKEAEFIKHYGAPHLVVVSGNEYVGKLVNETEFHPKGYCRDCRHPHETAPNVTPEYDWLPSSDGALSPTDNFFSEDFLSLLTTAERSCLKLEPVRGPKAKGKRFFRLTGEPVVNFVGVPGFEGLSVYQCQRCKRLLHICYLRNCQLFRFVAGGDLPKPLPDIFSVGWEGDLSLCMTRRRYAQLIGKPGTRKITTSRIWVVPDDRFVREINDQNHPQELRWASGRFFPDLS